MTIQSDKWIRNMAKKLSKSRIISGLQCVKRLHQEVYHPERAEIPDATEQIFAQGNQIGDLACKQYPNGVLIDRNPLSEALIKQKNYSKILIALPYLKPLLNMKEYWSKQIF